MSRIPPSRSKIPSTSISLPLAGKTGFAARMLTCANSTSERTQAIRRVQMPEVPGHRGFFVLRTKARGRHIAVLSFLLLFLSTAIVPHARADEPFAPSRDYDL